MKIALLCPSRERLDKNNILIKSIEETCKDINTFTLYFGVDDNDPTKESLKEITKNKSYIKIIDIHNNGQFLGLGKIWNIMAKEASEDIFAMIGNDMIFETKNWDDIIINKASKFKRDGLYLIHCNDGMRGPGNKYANIQPLAVNSFIGRKYYDLLGQYTREEWKHGYHDTWLHEVFSEIGRRIYLDDVIIRHLHHSEVGGTDSVSQNLESQWNKDDNNRNDFYYITMREIRNKEIQTLRNEVIINLPKLSILICSLNRRHEFLKRLISLLKPQISKEVEVLVSIDDGENTIGRKRNNLLQQSIGKYIAFIDDDDIVSDVYVSSILKAVEFEPDVVGIHLQMIENNTLTGLTYHSLKYKTWYDEPTDKPGLRKYYRNPNHLNPVKRELALKVGFPDINNGEDRVYSYNLLQFINTEVCIDDPIYTYMVRNNKTI